MAVACFASWSSGKLYLVDHKQIITTDLFPPPPALSTTCLSMPWFLMCSCSSTLLPTWEIPLSLLRTKINIALSINPSLISLLPEVINHFLFCDIQYGSSYHFQSLKKQLPVNVSPLLDCGTLEAKDIILIIFISIA